MQALSFAVHIPLVCFGIAFPSMVLLRRVALPPHRRPALPHAREALVEGDDRAVRRRRRDRARSSRSRWACCGPNFMATFGDVFGLAFGARGLLVLHRGDLHRHLRLRLGPHVAAHAPPLRDPGRGRRVHGVAVRHLRERVDEPPAAASGSSTASAVDVQPWRALFGNGHLWPELTHMYFAGLHRRRLPRGGGLRLGLAEGAARPLRAHRARGPAHDRRARRAGTARRRRLDRPARHRRPADQARRDRGARADDQGRRAPRPRLVRGRRGQVRHRDPQASRCSRTTTRTRRSRASTPCRRQTARRVNVVRIAFQTMVGIGTLLALLGVLHLIDVVPAPPASSSRGGSCGGWWPPARCRSWRSSPAG